MEPKLIKWTKNPGEMQRNRIRSAETEKPYPRSRGNKNATPSPSIHTPAVTAKTAPIQDRALEQLQGRRRKLPPEFELEQMDGAFLKLRHHGRDPDCH